MSIVAKRSKRQSRRLRHERSSGGFVRAGATIVAASTIAFSGQLFAADAAKKDSTLEEVIITGLKKSLQSAQAIKKNAEQEVDSVTAQDIGALPDRSVSEALQRIPGITLQRTNENRDPARLASEGGGVFVRGLSWVRSELNGRDVFSANNGRNLSFEDVSADLLAGVDVYKNPSAELVEGGVGGIVNLRTRLPFDQNRRLTAFSADYNYADLRERGFISGNALYSNQWALGSGRFGALASVSVGNIGNRTDSIQTGRYEPHTISAGDAAATGVAQGSTVYMPNSYGWRRIDWQQRRASFAGALQWAPNERTVFTLQTMMAQADPHDIEHTLGDGPGGGLENLNSSYKFDGNGVLTSGTMQNALLGTDTRYGESHKWTNDFSLNAKYTPNDKWAFSGDVQYVKSHTNVLSLTSFTQLSQPGTLAFNLGGDTPYMQFNQTPNSTANESDYWWAAAMDHLEKNDANSWAQRADAEYSFDNNPWLRSLRFGVRATQKEAITRETGWNWSLLSNQFWGNGGGAPVYLDQGVTPASAASLFTYNNFFRGSVGVPGIGWFGSDSLVSHGTAYAYSILHATETSGWGWTPLSTDFTQAKPGADNINGGVNDQHEKTQAAYMLLRFGHDTGLGPMDGNIGVRVVRTQVDGGNLLRIGTLNGGTPANCAAAAPAGGCAAYDAAYTFAQGANMQGSTVTNEYTDVLPSLNVRFKFRDDLQWRFAVSKAIVRPNFSQMQSDTSLGFGYDGVTFQPTTGNTGSGGNVKLKPTRSTQFDTSLEWYFAPTGSLTFAQFYKDVRDYIFAGDALETYTSNGQTLAFDVTRNMNGAHGTIEGLELGYQQFYESLPGAFGGLGVSANFTYVNSNGGRNTAVNILEGPQLTGAADSSLPLEGMSKTSYNFGLLYEKYGFSGRLAYNWRSRYLLTTSAANIQRPVWSENYGQLDGSVFYTINEYVKVGLQGTNLLNSRTFLDVGGADLAPRYSWTDTDRRIAAAVRVSF